MKSGFMAALVVIPLYCTAGWAVDAPQSVTNMGNVKGGDVVPAQRIIDQKCTRCHSGKIIENAIFADKDMARIQKEMEKKGAKLEASERDVLGIFWKERNPLKKGK